MSRRKSAPPSLLRHIPPFILAVLRRVGIRIEPFLTVWGGEKLALTGDMSGYIMAFEDAAAIEEIMAVEPGSDREEITGWFDQGRLCFGVRDGQRLVAKMWCDLEAFHFPPNYRVLEYDEAYLYAACVASDYRGKNLAPLMRAGCCAALHELGRSRFCSYTDYFNYPARRFKEKLGARNEVLRLHVSLFGRWSGTVTLKRY